MSMMNSRDIGSRWMIVGSHYAQHKKPTITERSSEYSSMTGLLFVLLKLVNLYIDLKKKCQTFFFRFLSRSQNFEHFLFFSFFFVKNRFFSKSLHCSEKSVCAERSVYVCVVQRISPSRSTYQPKSFNVSA